MSSTISLSGVPTDISFAVSKENLVAVGTYRSSIEIVDIDQKKVVSVNEYEAMPRVLTFTLDGTDRLIVAFDNQFVEVFDIGGGGALKKVNRFHIAGEGEGVVANSIVYINEHMFGIGGVNGEVTTWDDRVGPDCVFRVSTGSDQVSQMIQSPDRNSLLCAMGDGKVSTVKLRGGVVSQGVANNTPFSCLGTFRDDTKLLVGGENGRIYVFDIGQYAYHSDVLRPHKAAVNAMIPITERIGVVGYDDGSIRAYNFFPHKPVGTVGEHPSMVEHMDISSDGRTLVTVAHEEELRFWDIGFLEEIDAAAEAAEVKFKHHLKSSNKQNSGEFFSGLAEDEEQEEES